VHFILLVVPGFTLKAIWALPPIPVFLQANN